jgi:hypothetical protein
VRDITKLPKWAQEHIRDLERQRDVAVATLNGFVDNQTESPVYYEDHPCTGESPGPVCKRKYLQTDQIEVKHVGLYLRVLLRDDRIDIQWEAGQYSSRPVMMVPVSYQMIELRNPKEEG